MTLELQTTIESPVSIKGSGLHTGCPVCLTFKPAPAGAGRFFRRVDLPGEPVIPAAIDRVTEVLRGTTLGDSGIMVHTVEHVLSAAFGMGIDNLEIAINSCEPPAADGSALPFVNALREAGLKTLDVPASTCRLSESFWWEDGDKLLAYLPDDRFEIMFTFAHPVNSICQVRNVVIDSKHFADEIAFARTFGFEHEFEMLRAKNLALGGNLENAVVVKHDGTLMNSGGLRDSHEFVRHKILDLIGDLALIGRRITGRIIAHKTGHAANVRFARALCERLTEERERKQSSMMNIEAIREIIPHRYPFLLVDKILAIDPGKSAIGIKNVTANEEFFNGHFPTRSIMPGVLIVEAMAQVGAVLFLSKEENRGKIPLFVGIDKVRFRRQVLPGDRLEMTVATLKVRSNIGKVSCVARVNGEEVASGELMFSIV
ncbi:MAG: UDP-3-O-[3-hydroxymyristoyl] N-acetylglucosamine deacetylase [Candidatus Riflebacteria bacterium]|nr:UDP-3-O-[3-hydroxymyristoyl] N-acetylglucosamine deacetylase [Candidatus Riflebacteria bacterium]